MGELFMSTRTINGVTLALLKGNIVEVRADAIVNAANSGLRGGGGVDGAIHRAVGPIYSGTKEDEVLLASAYQSCLDLAEHYRISSIAFPSLSTGVYGYPLDEAAPIALHTIIQHVQKPTSLQQVMVVLYGDEALQAFKRALGERY